MSDHNERTAAVIRYINMHGAITNRECRALLGISYDDAIKMLGNLTANGLLSREGVSSATRYVLRPPQKGDERRG